jgi:hypothetical protein
LDSGFCVLNGIVELKKWGVFAAALIKKRQYWPKYIDGDLIKDHFNDMEVGSIDALSGKLDNIPFHVFAMKEEDYVMMLMSTYGTLERVGDVKHRTIGPDKVKKSFQYPEVVHNHYQRRDAIDSHNARQQAPIALEETWFTTRWANRVFAYLMATSEVNTNLAETEFGHSKMRRPQLEFRRLLAKDLIENAYHQEASKPPSSRSSKRKRDLHGHELIKLPQYRKFRKNQIVKSKSKYPYNYCECKGSRVRTYCRCTQGLLLCSACFVTHCNGEATAAQT